MLEQRRHLLRFRDLADHSGNWLSLDICPYSISGPFISKGLPSTHEGWHCQERIDVTWLEDLPKDHPDARDRIAREELRMTAEDHLCFKLLDIFTCNVRNRMSLDFVSAYAIVTILSHRRNSCFPDFTMARSARGACRNFWSWRIALKTFQKNFPKKLSKKPFQKKRKFRGASKIDGVHHSLSSNPSCVKNTKKNGRGRARSRCRNV